MPYYTLPNIFPERVIASSQLNDPPHIPGSMNYQSFITPPPAAPTIRGHPALAMASHLPPVNWDFSSPQQQIEHPVVSLESQTMPTFRYNSSFTSPKVMMLMEF